MEMDNNNNDTLREVLGLKSVEGGAECQDRASVRSSEKVNRTRTGGQMGGKIGGRYAIPLDASGRSDGQMGRWAADG